MQNISRRGLFASLALAPVALIEFGVNGERLHAANLDASYRYIVVMQKQFSTPNLQVPAGHPFADAPVIMTDGPAQESVAIYRLSEDADVR